MTSGTGPHIGSLRAIAERFGLGVGDSLFVSLDDSGESQTWGVTSETIGDVRGLRRLSILVGIPQLDNLKEEALLFHIGAAIWVELPIGTADQKYARLRRAFYSRGEPELADLLPASASPDSTEVLDSILGVLAPVQPS